MLFAFAFICACERSGEGQVHSTYIVCSWLILLGQNKQLYGSDIFERKHLAILKISALYLEGCEDAFYRNEFIVTTTGFGPLDDNCGTYVNCDNSTGQIVATPSQCPGREWFSNATGVCALPDGDFCPWSKWACRLYMILRWAINVTGLPCAFSIFMWSCLMWKILHAQRIRFAPVKIIVS